MLRSSVSRLPIRAGNKIIGVGKNYPLHVKEMGGKKVDVGAEPVLFLKAWSSLTFPGSPIRLAKGIGEVHHEVELGIMISKQLFRIDENKAMDGIEGYFCAIDLTARDIQTRMKDNGLPWTRAKAYDSFCPVSDVISRDFIPNPQDLGLWLTVNGHPRQDGNTRDMIHKIPFIISNISQMMTLEPGDLILTGTPSGVGPIKPGDVVKAGIRGHIEMEYKVVEY